MSAEQILIAGLPFVDDAIEHNADDRQRLTKIAALLSQIETLGWFIDVFGETPEPALAAAIRRHSSRKQTVKRFQAWRKRVSNHLK